MNWEVLDRYTDISMGEYYHDYIGLRIAYPGKQKLIIQSQLVDIHSLIGNMGGYIGLFLGKIFYLFLFFGNLIVQIAHW